MIDAAGADSRAWPAGTAMLCPADISASGSRLAEAGSGPRTTEELVFAKKRRRWTLLKIGMVRRLGGAVWICMPGKSVLQSLLLAPTHNIGGTASAHDGDRH